MGKTKQSLTRESYKEKSQAIKSFTIGKKALYYSEVQLLNDVIWNQISVTKSVFQDSAIKGKYSR